MYVIQSMSTRPELYKRLVYTEWIFSGLVFIIILVLPESPRKRTGELRHGSRFTECVRPFFCSLVVA